MAVEYDSDSSVGDDVETGVTLGYASRESTGDDFSQLGGRPTWLNQEDLPSGALARCQVCNGLLILLLQLDAGLPKTFPGHERALYIFTCPRKACRRKSGSIRGLRYTRITQRDASTAAVEHHKSNVDNKTSNASRPEPLTLGNTIFGSPLNSSSSKPPNPFGTSAGENLATNPFAVPPQEQAEQASIDQLPQTFAQKARIREEIVDIAPRKSVSSSPWPDVSAFPAPFPSHNIDADKEYLESETETASQAVQGVQIESEASGSTVDAKDAFESSMDKTFQRFADRISQNPEQILRYDYGGQPLLYSRTDAVGGAWPRTSWCPSCGASRTFELQLTPHAITELEADDVSLDGMDWGTIILAVCEKDCEGWNEEWVGVQWEDISGKKPA